MLKFQQKICKHKSKLIVVGQTPPPIHGQAICIQMYLNSKLKDSFDLIHLDTSDRRNLSNIGKFDYRNVYIALKCVLKMAYLCIFKKPSIAYIPISRNNWAYLRDGLFIIVAKLSSNAKILIHLHGEDFRTFYESTNIFMKLFIDITMKCCDKAIVLAERLRWIFDKWFDPENIEAVTNGIMINLDIIKKHVESNRDNVLLTHLGNLYPDKGTYDLVKAFKIVADKHPCVNLEIAGEWDNRFPEYKENVLQFIKDNGLERKVHFRGVITGAEKEMFLVKSDLFILSSLKEGVPMVIIEAMATANPIVATNVGGVPEVVVDGKTGFLVEKQNPEEMANAIIKLIEDAELRIQMGKAGRKRYEEFYTEDKAIDSMLRVFQKTIDIIQ